MSIIKAEIKMETAHEIGCKIEDLLQAAEKELHVMGGAKSGFQQAATRVEALQKQAELEEKEGKLSIDQYKVAKDWVNRAVGILRQLASAAESNEQQVRGKTIAYKQAVDTIQKVHLVEKTKATAAMAPPDTVVEGAEAGQMRDRVTGQHPGNPLGRRKRRADLKSVPAHQPEKSDDQADPGQVESPKTPPEVA